MRHSPSLSNQTNLAKCGANSFNPVNEPIDDQVFFRDEKMVNYQSKHEMKQDKNGIINQYEKVRLSQTLVSRYNPVERVSDDRVSQSLNQNN